jgi:hypothetical protein
LGDAIGEGQRWKVDLGLLPSRRSIGTYLMARHTFAAAGAIAVLVPVDADGLETERLEKIEARLAHVTPSHH